MITKSRGFTLLEVMAVVAMIGILAGLAGPSFTAALRRRTAKRLAHSVASMIYQARSTAMIKRKDTEMSFRSGFFIAFTRNDRANFARFPVAPNETFDPTLSIVANQNRIVFNANGFVTDGNLHPISSAVIQIVDATTAETITMTVNYSGSIDWS